ncbi:hypothetical protein [Streptomyces sp. NPDC018000]|uniref:hypothetical protein n=1 Tax=Streptomyces sp. NPDC018000 TaxID=3365028 RepID=UPI00379C448F
MANAPALFGLAHRDDRLIGPLGEPGAVGTGAASGVTAAQVGADRVVQAGEQARIEVRVAQALPKEPLPHKGYQSRLTVLVAEFRLPVDLRLVGPQSS